MESAEVYVARQFAEHRDVLRETLEALQPAMERAAELWTHCLKSGGKVIFAGNGGSAADAQHMAAELLGRFNREREPLPSLALTANTSTLTAIANDYGYGLTFARQLQALGNPPDVFVAYSTSGNSENIIAAARIARQRRVPVIGMTGASGGALGALCDVLLNVPSTSTPRIQEAHLLLGHCLCGWVELRLFPNAPGARRVGE